MPLLHLDVSTKLVQYIKLAQAETGTGTETVRAPRLVLEGAEREHVLAVIRTALQRRPKRAACASHSPSAGLGRAGWGRLRPVAGICA